MRLVCESHVWSLPYKHSVQKMPAFFAKTLPKTYFLIVIESRSILTHVPGGVAFQQTNIVRNLSATG